MQREFDAPVYALALKAASAPQADYTAEVNRCKREIQAEDLLDELMDCADILMGAVKRGETELVGKIVGNVYEELARKMADVWFETGPGLTTHQVAAMTCYGFEGQR